MTKNQRQYLALSIDWHCLALFMAIVAGYMTPWFMAGIIPCTLIGAYFQNKFISSDV